MQTFSQIFADVARKLETLEAKASKVDVTVTGTGNADQDEQSLKKALTYLQGSKRTLWLAGDIFSRSWNRIGSSIAVRGKDGAHMKILSEGAFVYSKSGFPSKPYSTHPKATAIAGYDCFQTEAPLPVKRGDWVLLYSDDQLIVHPHNGVSGYQSPAEIHRVERVDGNIVYIAGAMIDNIATNGRVAKLPEPIQSPLIENVSFEFVGQTQANYASCLYLSGCASPRLVNVRIYSDGPGAINMKYCMDGSIDSPTVEGTKAADGVYGIMLSLCNGIIVNQGHMNGTRHPITSSSGFAVGRRRYGTPCNVIVNGGVWNIMTKLNGKSRIGVDTHAEGKGWVHDGLVINVGSNNALSNYGANSRSRNTIWKNCTFRGNSFRGTGLSIYSPNVVVQNCLFENLLWPLRLRYYAQTNKPEWFSNLVVKGNTFRNCLGPAVWVKHGNNHTIAHNIVENCGERAGGNPQYESCLVLLEYGTGHRVIGNDLPKSKNKYSIAQYNRKPQDIYVAGNYLTDYGGTCGFMKSAHTKIVII
jgi:hypothetical protein